MTEYMSSFKTFLKKIDTKRSLIVAGIIIACSLGAYLAISYVEQRTSSKSTYNVQHLTEVPDVVVGKLVTLKQLKEEDFINFHNMFSNDVRKNLEYPPYINLGWSIEYLKEEMERTRKGEQLMYVIFDNKENKLIGSVEVRELNDSDPGQLGCWVNENYRGGGRFQESLDLISKTYFALKPHEKQYIAHVRLWNKRSYYALKKYGFKDAGFFYEKGEPARYILELKREQVMKK